jgi:hypothetical protein
MCTDSLLGHLTSRNKEHLPRLGTAPSVRGVWRQPGPSGTGGRRRGPRLLDIFRVKEGPYNALTCIFAGQPPLSLSQEIGLVPTSSVGSLTWC